MAQAYGTRVAGGSNGTRAVKVDGTLWSWGDNTYGEVGNGSHGTSLSVRTPTQIGAATDWRAVSSGENPHAGAQERWQHLGVGEESFR
ncbi:MAG: hypothetical protein IPI73_21720 [Betaproteobacteria bacterium]|nr:hypothetical protein [Betaproteobacteria bacterium]